LISIIPQRRLTGIGIFYISWFSALKGLGNTAWGLIPRKERMTSFSDIKRFGKIGLNHANRSREPVPYDQFRTFMLASIPSIREVTAPRPRSRYKNFPQSDVHSGRERYHLAD
jgi:hypothetical protein